MLTSTQGVLEDFVLHKLKHIFHYFNKVSVLSCAIKTLILNSDKKWKSQISQKRYVAKLYCISLYIDNYQTIFVLFLVLKRMYLFYLYKQ